MKKHWRLQKVTEPISVLFRKSLSISSIGSRLCSETFSSGYSGIVAGIRDSTFKRENSFSNIDNFVSNILKSLWVRSICLFSFPCNALQRTTLMSDLKMQSPIQTSGALAPGTSLDIAFCRCEQRSGHRARARELLPRIVLGHLSLAGGLVWTGFVSSQAFSSCHPTIE